MMNWDVLSRDLFDNHIHILHLLHRRPVHILRNEIASVPHVCHHYLDRYQTYLLSCRRRLWEKRSHESDETVTAGIGLSCMEADLHCCLRSHLRKEVEDHRVHTGCFHLRHTYFILHEIAKRLLLT